MDPLTSIDSRRQDYNKNQSLKLANYRFQKKYDLLLEGLLEEYENSKNEKRLIGQLYSAIDLAEFYTYGFINYKKSLELYNEAEALSKRIKASGHTDDLNSEGIITYYQASGRYAVPLKFDFQKISTRISFGRKRINRIYQHQGRGKSNDSDLPTITSLVTDNYAYAIQVDRDVLSPDYFDQFEERLTNETRAYFKHRYKLPKSDHEYYINFNILRGLTSVFDFSALPTAQIKTISNYIEKVKTSKIEDSDKLQLAYLDFAEVLCLTELEEYEKAISVFNDFERQIRNINKEIDDYIEYLKASKNKAIADATAKTVGYMAITIISMGHAMGSGGGFYINMTPAGVMDFAGSVSTIQRQLSFTGESAYSKKWNILLNIDDQLQLFRSVGKSFHKTGDLDKSIRYNKEAVNIITNLRSTITTERGRISFAGFRDEIYSYLIEDLFHTQKYTEAFYYAENSRARSLVDLLGSKADLSFGNRDKDDYVNKIRNLQVCRDRLKEITSISDQQVTYIQGLETELEREYDSHRDRGIKTVDPDVILVAKTKKRKETVPKEQFNELMSLITVNNLDHQQIQNILPKDTTLVEYFVAGSGIFAWIIDKNSFFSINLGVKPEELMNRIKIFIQKIKSRENQNSKELEKSSREIYAALFKPLEDHITNKSVYLICHNFLHSLPFDVLFTGNAYLVEKYAFSYLPSSSVIQFLEPIDTTKMNLLALGNPESTGSLQLSDLPGAEQEARYISALFSNKKLFIRDKATETNFRKESPSFNITHIASHGFFDEKDALNSKIILAADNQNDGQLTAKELYGISRVSDLLILSACETARAEISKGNDLLGLMRGFFFSGASSLVASLWKVDDIATLKMMERFYKHMLLENKPPMIALQNAKRDMIRSNQYRTPFYWASFNLYGLGI
jgi:CHAT domain-containing protein